MLSLQIAMSDADLEAIHEAIRAVPHEDRVRLVERAKAELLDDGREASGDPSAIIGMMADEPEVMDRVCELAMRARSKPLTP